MRRSNTRVKAARVGLGLLQRQLAKRIRERPAALILIEKRGWIPDPDTQHRIAKVLKTTPGELFGG